MPKIQPLLRESSGRNGPATECYCESITINTTAINSLGIHTFICWNGDGKAFLGSTIVSATNVNDCTCSRRPAGHEDRLEATQSLHLPI